MNNQPSIPELTLKCEQIRKRLVEVVYKAKAGHIGGDLSSLNALTALYFRIMNVDPKNPKMDGRDRFIMSKGHCVEALYSVLEAKGFITKELVDTYGEYLSVLAGHPPSRCRASSSTAAHWDTDCPSVWAVPSLPRWTASPTAPSS